jgi:hypothetical protein
LIFASRSAASLTEVDFRLALRLPTEVDFSPRVACPTEFRLPTEVTSGELFRSSTGQSPTGGHSGQALHRNP